MNLNRKGKGDNYGRSKDSSVLKTMKGKISIVTIEATKWRRTERPKQKSFILRVSFNNALSILIFL